MTHTGILLGLGVAWALALSASPAPVAAECSRELPMPAFSDVAPTASRVIVGTVVAFIDPPPGEPEHQGAFRLRVDEVLRGAAPEVMEVQGLRTRVPRGQGACIVNPIIYANLGDVMAIALHGDLEGVDHPVNAVAWIEGEGWLAQGDPERLTLEEIRRVTDPEGATTDGRVAWLEWLSQPMRTLIVALLDEMIHVTDAAPSPSP